MASNAAKEFTLDFEDVDLQSDISSQEPEPDLVIEAGFAFAFGRDGNGVQEREGIGYFLTKGIEVAVITAGRAEAVDLSLDGSELAWPVTGVGTELPCVLVAGLAPSPALWGRLRGRMMSLPKGYAVDYAQDLCRRREDGLRCREHGW
jgi:hypothetical protein